MIVSGPPSQSKLVISSSTKVTVRSPFTSQLSASSVTTVTSGAGISLKHSTSIEAGLDAVGSVVSAILNVCVTSVVLPEQSSILYVRTTVVG